MQHTLFALIRGSGRFALHAFVIGPALVLYFLVVAIALNGSLSQQFLNEARRLTDGAPAGKVMQCIEHSSPTLQPRTPNPEEDAPPRPYKVPVLSQCHPEAVDSDSWSRMTDSVLLNVWMMAALFGAASGFLAIRRRKARSFSDTRSLLFKKGQSDEH